MHTAHAHTHTHTHCRCRILLRSYGTSLEQDTHLLNHPDPSFTPYKQLAIQMRVSEKQILTDAIKYTQTISEELEAIQAIQEKGGASQEAPTKGRVLAAPVSRKPKVDSQQNPSSADTGGEEVRPDPSSPEEERPDPLSPRTDPSPVRVSEALTGTGEEERVPEDNADTFRVEEVSSESNETETH